MADSANGQDKVVYHVQYFNGLPLPTSTTQHQLDSMNEMELSSGELDSMKEMELFSGDLDFMKKVELFSGDLDSMKEMELFSDDLGGDISKCGTTWTQQIVRSILDKGDET